MYDARLACLSGAMLKRAGEAGLNYDISSTSKI